MLQAQLGAALTRLDATVSGLEASRARRLELRVAELERRLSMDSTDSERPARRSGSGEGNPAGAAGVRAGVPIDDLRERYDTAVTSGLTHNRLRDWHDGNHPGYALADWLRAYKERVFLFTRDFAVDWTNDLA